MTVKHFQEVSVTELAEVEGGFIFAVMAGLFAAGFTVGELLANYVYTGDPFTDL